MHVNTCILGRTYFVERSIHFIEEHWLLIITGVQANAFPKNHPLHKIFNRHTLKLSYSCMPNMKSVISSYNKYVLSNFNSPTQQPDTCNCRKKPDCPLEGKCLQSNVIYQATVTTATTTETYVGLATNFKERYRNHQSSFRRSNRRNETELSKYIWTLQDSKKAFHIKWKVLKKCKPYWATLAKNVIFVFMKSSLSFVKKSFLNRLNEQASSCPHRNRFALHNSRVT